MQNSPTNNKPPYKSYQLTALEKCNSLHKTGIIARPGAGKTRIAIDSVNQQLQLTDRIGRVRPILVVCSGPAINTWADQFPFWADLDPVFMHYVTGNPKERLALWRKACNEGTGIFICNWSVFLRDFNMISNISWSSVIGDEYQRTMRGHKTKTFQLFRTFSRHIEVGMLCSGSPIRKHPATMWTLFALSQPKIYTSYWDFVNRYCHVVETEHAKIIIGPKNIEEFKEILHKHIAFIPPKVIDEELPAGSRMPLYVHMDSEQAKIYQELSSDLIAILDEGGVLYAQSRMTLSLRLKQLLCCPKLLNPKLGMGAGFAGILDAIEEDPHCVIFVPFREACTHIKAALLEAGHLNVYIIRGGITADEQKRAIQGFSETKGIIICTIQFSESFELISTNKAYFLGYCYTVDENEQAEGRVQRISSQYETVFWNYVHYVGTVDDYYMSELGQDFIRQTRVMQLPDRLTQALEATPYAEPLKGVKLEELA